MNLRSIGSARDMYGSISRTRGAPGGGGRASVTVGTPYADRTAPRNGAHGAVGDAPPAFGAIREHFEPRRSELHGVRRANSGAQSTQDTEVGVDGHHGRLPPGAMIRAILRATAPPPFSGRRGDGRGVQRLSECCKAGQGAFDANGGEWDPEVLQHIVPRDRL